MFLRKGAIVFIVCLFMFVGTASSSVNAVRQEHFLDYSEDNYKVAFISGNLTAAMTRDWPRVVFRHSTDPFAPTFEVSLPCLYLFNDTNGDGLFTYSEVIYSGYMDWNHVAWNMTSIEFGNDTAAGEYAQFRMSTTLSLYEGMVNQTVYQPEWANITFWFRINENTTTRENSYGNYVVSGRTELVVNFSLEVRKHMNVTGIALEQLLQGGATTYMFLLRESESSDALSNYTEVSSRIDETEHGLNFTHKFVMPHLAEQELLFSKEDRTVLAYYHFSSDPRSGLAENAVPVRINSSYYTTGTGLMLHTAYSVNNSTNWIVHEASLGIVESGYVSRVRDWFMDNLQTIVLTTGVVVTVVVLVTYVILKSRELKANRVESNKDEDNLAKR